MIKKWLFLIIAFLMFSSLAQADSDTDSYSRILDRDVTEGENAKAKVDNFTLSGYSEIGKNSTAEDYEEEDTDDYYTYTNYHLKFGHKVSDQLSYDIGSFIYDKDYDTKDSLDNISRIFKTNWSYYFRSLKEESLKLNVKLNYKEKRFNNTPRKEYDQITVAPTFTFKEEKLYTIDLSAGIDNYDYLDNEEKDQLKVFGKIGLDRYFLDKKFQFTSSYRIEQLERKKVNRKRTKNELLGGFDYIFDWPLINKITTRLGWGERDTKEEDERDEDYDYEYWKYYTKTEHNINLKLKTNLKYQYFKKDYISADLDHSGFYIMNEWDYEILDNKTKRVWLNLGIEHKDVDYTLKRDNNYKKETAEIKVNYTKKKNWQISLSLKESSYDFNGSTNDKKRYYTTLSGEKLFLEGDLGLSLDLKHRYTDYDEANDEKEDSVRVGFKYRF